MSKTTIKNANLLSSVRYLADLRKRSVLLSKWLANGHDTVKKKRCGQNQICIRLWIAEVARKAERDGGSATAVRLHDQSDT